jgi:hypothetical protein
LSKIDGRLRAQAEDVHPRRDWQRPFGLSRARGCHLNSASISEDGGQTPLAVFPARHSVARTQRVAFAGGWERSSGDDRI